MHKSQAFFSLLGAFIGGIAVASLMRVSDVQLLWVSITGLSALTVSAYHRTFGQTERGIRRRKIGFLVGCVILVAAGGVWRYNQFFSAHSVLEQFAGRKVGLDKLQEVPVLVGGFIDGDPVTSGAETSFSFRVRQVIANRTIAVNERTLVRLTGAPMLAYGQTLVLRGAVRVPEDFGDFDYVAYLRKDGIRTMMIAPAVVSGRGEILLGSGERLALAVRRKVFAVRHAFERAVNSVLNEPNASYVNGILLGTRAAIPASLREAFQRTSTSHILAISGYNITVIAEAVLALLVSFVRRRTAFWITLLAVVLFTVATGASASVVRAAVMGTVLLAANNWGRRYDARNAIAFAGGVMLYINPLALRFDAGFQLSFLAVLGLLYVRPVIGALVRRIPEIAGLKEVALATISAQIAVFPLILYTFRTFSLVALPVNLIVLPLVPYAMLLGFLTGLGALFSSLVGKMFAMLVWAVSSFQLSVVTGAAALSFASVSGSVSFMAMIALYALMIGCIGALRKKYGDRI